MGEQKQLHQVDLFKMNKTRTRFGGFFII